MSKPPPNVPERGDRCHLRADPTKKGTLVKYDPASNWSTVKWENYGPKVCHRFELVKEEQS